MTSKSLPWDTVEKAIVKEIKWLEDNLASSPFKNKRRKFCEKCLLRRLAILIVSGKIKSRDIKSEISLFGEDKSFDIGKPHGKDWHSEMMKKVASYFKKQGYEIVIEPELNLGRADLGVYKKSERNLLVEVGTVSLFKLLFNLESMEGCDFLLIPDSNHAIEFSVIKSSYPAK